MSAEDTPLSQWMKAMKSVRHDEPQVRSLACEGYEEVALYEELRVGLCAIIAIHDRRLGPALGGCRMWPYPSQQEALADVLRLAHGMTLKAAMANVPIGGGKAVIIGDPKRDKSAALLRSFGRFVDSFEGRYYTGEDVGTSVEDIAVVAQVTPYVVGTPHASGDPSRATALGVLFGIKAALQHVFGTPRIRGRRIAIQGLGHVGYKLCHNLSQQGATLMVTDLDSELVDQACREFEARSVDPKAIYDVPADVFSPCAMGGILNDGTIPRLRCAIVAGSANNQLRELRHGDALHQKGILYAPDYVINAGGLINVSLELAPNGYDRAEAIDRIAGIETTLSGIFAIARRTGAASNIIAEKTAHQRLEGHSAAA